jgi:hypothetical protein
MLQCTSLAVKYLPVEALALTFKNRYSNVQLLPGRLLSRQLCKPPGSNQRAACDELSRVDAR